MCLTKGGDNEGGFVFIPKSHKQHQSYFKRKKLMNLKDNWYVVP